MAVPMADAAIEAYAAELLKAYDAGRQIAPISDGDPDFDHDAAYRIAREITELREARGRTAGGPQNWFYKPHDLADLRRLGPDVGAGVGYNSARDWRWVARIAAGARTSA